MESLFANIDGVVQHRPLLAFASALVAGLLSAASPCVLATIPLVIGYVGGYAGDNRKRAALFSGTFVVGLTLTFTLLGAAASLLGRMLGFLGVWLYAGIAILALAMGLQLLGLVRLPFPSMHNRSVSQRGIMGAFSLGLLTGTVSSPCATPVLAVILALASTQGNVVYGSSLLFVYAVGHCALIFLAGLSVSWTDHVLTSRGFQGVAIWSRRASGTLLIMVAFYFGWRIV